MGKNRLFVLIFILAFTVPSMGKVNRYVVYLRDKGNNSFTIEKPDEFLSARALKRRNDQNIGITMQDLPVSDVYLEALKTSDGVAVHFTTKWMNAVLVEMDETKVAEIESLDFVKKVVYVAPDSKLAESMHSGRIAAIMKKYAEETGEYESNAQNEFIGADAMHTAGYRGEGILIAVFDSGFEFIDQSPYYTHLFSDDKIIASRDYIRGSYDVFQYDSHGSKVLSCISAFREGEFSGTAPRSDLILCVTEDISSEYRIEEYNWLFAAEFADSLGADIINSSVGYSYFDDDRMDYTYDDLNGKTAIITRAAAVAASKGILVVSSNGNEGNNSWQYLNAPADADSILSVGAATYSMERASFSSYGPTSDDRIKPDISALGSWVRLVYKNEITYANGTSFSAPMISGLAAGFWQAYPELTNIEVIQYLKMTASQATNPDTLLGYGIPNFIKAFNKVKLNEGDIENKFVVFPNPVTNKRIIYFYLDSLADENIYNLNFFDLKGSHIRTEEIAFNNSLDMIEVDVSFLKPGSYILTYINGTERRKSKLVVL